ncbi:MAG: hypothetical protein ACOC1Q_01125, partial [Desulfosalsimonas sp.]
MRTGIKKKTLWIVMAAFVAAAALMFSGCASTGDLESLQDRVDAMEQNVDSAATKADQAQATADECCEDASEDAAAA